MIKYKIIENFIEEKTCNELVSDAKKILKLNSEKEILNNNRLIVNSTSITFHNIISYSKTWYNLNELFHSKILF